MDKLDQYKPIFYQHRKQKIINHYAIIGERHSGTNWLERLIRARLNISITRSFGSKHFIELLNPNLMAGASGTLFICITRNIYDWIGGFFKLPHHVDSSIAYNIHKFLLSEWNCGSLDKHFFTKQSYKNIFDLRSNKLLFYLYFLPNIVDNMIIIRYEDLLIDPEIIISFISKEYSISKTNTEYFKLILPKHKFRYVFTDDIIDVINSNTDWKIENEYKYYLEPRTQTGLKNLA